MNHSDVFRKSDIGRDEIKTQSLGVLPREARTLLIMIDGKRTYQNYLDTLDDSKMFAEFGGVAPLFELLLELDCIEVAGSSAAEEPRPTPPPQAVPPTVPVAQPPVPEPSPAPSPQADSQAEFDNTFNNSTSNDNKESAKGSILGNLFKSKNTATDYASVKSDLATYIEKNAPAQDAWGYLLDLEQCNTAAQLLVLVQRIQASGDNTLARGMSDFAEKIKTQI